jgi:hypothetical protein
MNLLCHTFGESINTLFRVFGPFFRRFLVAPGKFQSGMAADDTFLDFGLALRMRHMTFLCAAYDGIFDSESTQVIVGSNPSNLTVPSYAAKVR